MAANAAGRETDGRLAESVLSDIERVRVWVRRDRDGGILLLTDSAGRSFPIFVGGPEAVAIEPWLSGRGALDDLDLHTALVRALHALGGRIRRVTVNDLKSGTFYGVLSVASPTGETDVDCRPSDGLNLAARTGAPVLAAEHVTTECLLTRKDGRTASPRWAWHLTRQQLAALPGRGRFANVPELLQALERAPESRVCRNALHELAPGLRSRDPSIADATDGLATLEAWVSRCEGTPLAPTAAGLLGAVYLCPPGRQAQKALPFLERAHAALPGDVRLAFDLATAYALLDRGEEALRLIAKWQRGAGLFRQCANFSSLWADPRFTELVGEPEPEAEERYAVEQLDFTIFRSRPSRPKEGRWWGPCVPGGVGRIDSGPLAVRGIGRRRLREIEKASGGGSLLRVQHVARAPREVGGPGLAFRLLAEQLGDIELPLPMPDGQLAMMAVQLTRAPRPMTHTTFCHVIKAAGGRVEAGLLAPDTRAHPSGLLVLKREDRRHLVPVAPGGAMAVAVEAGAPLLVDRRLAEAAAVAG